MMPSRRRFLIGCGAAAASAGFCGQLGRGASAPFSKCFADPPIDRRCGMRAINSI